MSTDTKKFKPTLAARLCEVLLELDPSLCFVEQEHTDPFGWSRHWVPESSSVESAASDSAKAILSAIENNGNFAPSRELWIGPIERKNRDFTFLTTWPLAPPTEIGESK